MDAMYAVGENDAYNRSQEAAGMNYHRPTRKSTNTPDYDYDEETDSSPTTEYGGYDDDTTKSERMPEAAFTSTKPETTANDEAYDETVKAKRRPINIHTTDYESEETPGIITLPHIEPAGTTNTNKN